MLLFKTAHNREARMVYSVPYEHLLNCLCNISHQTAACGELIKILDLNQIYACNI